jgi:hypothetical protein
MYSYPCPIQSVKDWLDLGVKGSILFDGVEQQSDFSETLNKTSQTLELYNQ